MVLVNGVWVEWFDMKFYVLFGVMVVFVGIMFVVCISMVLFVVGGFVLIF